MDHQNPSIQVLTIDQAEEVTGGVGVVGAAIGAATGAGSAAIGGGGPGQIAVGAATGAVAGFFGGIATVAGSKLGTALFGSKSVAVGVTGAYASQ